MRTLFLSSGGLNENTGKVFWDCVNKDPADTKIIYVPTAAIGSDRAKEGISVCVERLMNMGILFENIFIYDLSLLISAGYERTYSRYVQNIPAPLRLLSVEEINRFDVIVFGGGDASVLLGELNRTGFSEKVKQAIENGLIYFGISAGSMVAAGNFPDGLGYVSNPIIPHAESGVPCGDLPQDGPINLTNDQVILIKGDQKQIIC
jgi:peptidase E